MTELADYKDRYEDLRFTRSDDGVLLVELHTGEGSFAWTERAHRELGYAFTDIGADPANRVVVITGTGEDFLTAHPGEPPRSNLGWDKKYWEGKRLITNLLDIEVPVIGVANGPATIHAELVLLSDVVIASTTALFQDKPHFPSGLVPGDGAHVLWPALLGPNRGRAFMLKGDVLTAAQALDLGVVAEVLGRDQVLTRALELAHDFATRSTLALRYSRQCSTMHLKRLMHDMLGYGLALEGLALIDLLQDGTARS
jgi:enoyl-CoA hydratase/carnithine racemase